MPCCAAGTLPLLAYWAHHLPAGKEHPAALPILRLLLSCGVDPLAIPHQPDGSVRGRAGNLASLLLTCRSPLLLGAAVRHVLDQCREGSWVLAPPQVAQLCIAAHLAGPPLRHEAEQLLAQAVLQGDCFPAARHVPARGARSFARKSRRSGSEPLRHCSAAGPATSVGGEAQPSGASPSRRCRTPDLPPGHEDEGTSGEAAGPSSGHASPRAFELDPQILARCHGPEELIKLLLCPPHAGAEVADGHGEAEEAGQDSPAAEQTEQQRMLRAQLVADAAMHGAVGLLAVLLE